MNKGLYLPILGFLLLLSACRKDELTLPAKVFFEFELVSHEGEKYLKSGPPSNVLPDRMIINQGSLTIKSIEFDGLRDEGRDIFFESDLTQPLLVDLETGNSNQVLSFDVPQGVYNRIELNITLGWNDEIPLVLEGNISKGNLDEIPLRFEYNIHERIRVRAEPGKNSNKIVLRKDSPSVARVVIDAGQIFMFVNMSELQDAIVSLHEDRETIIISPRINNEIFNSMAARLERSIRVIFD
jgi:hypothetical protein